jgi:hypothetical protein
MELQRTVTFRAAFDKRDDNPAKNYGIHGVEIRFVVKGPKGATQFLLYTNWQLPHVTAGMLDEQRWLSDPSWAKTLFMPMPADLGYHAYEPQYEGQTRMGQCDILDDAPGGCFYDGSGLRAEGVFERLLREGDAGVWAALEEEYHALFDRPERDLFTATETHPDGEG